MTQDQRERLAAAEDERHTLLAQAAKEHLDNMAAEARRYQYELDHIEVMYRIRTGQEA